MDSLPYVMNGYTSYDSTEIVVGLLACFVSAEKMADRSRDSVKNS